MAITKVWIDEDACIGCRLCENTCSEVFEVNDVAKVKEEADFNKFEKKIKEAAEDCPSEAIHFEEK
jgi:ferredoxin